MWTLRFSTDWETERITNVNSSSRKIPWRLSKFQKQRQRRRLRAVDDIVATVDRALAKKGIITKAVEKWKEDMPVEQEMLPKDKYTIFDRKEKKYRKGIHSEWLPLATERNGHVLIRPQSYQNGPDCPSDSTLPDIDRRCSACLGDGCIILFGVEVLHGWRFRRRISQWMSTIKINGIQRLWHKLSSLCCKID